MSEKKMQEVVMEVTVGAFILVLFVLVAAFAIFASNRSLFRDTYRYEVIFSDVGGLALGSPVHFRGMPYGEIKKMTMLEDEIGVRVGMDLNHPITLHDGYSFEIVTASALGGKKLVVREGDINAPVLPQSAYEDLRGLPPADIMEEATKMLSEFRNAIQDGNLIENVSSAVSEINQIAQKINRGEGNLGRLLNEEGLYTDLEKSIANVKDLTAQLKQGEGTIGKLLYDDSIYWQIAGVSSNLNEVSMRLASGKGTLGKLLSEDETLYRDLTNTMASVRGFTGGLNTSTNGTIGALMHDRELYDKLVALIDEAKATVDDLRETSPITTFSSLFFGAF